MQHAPSDMLCARCNIHFATRIMKFGMQRASCDMYRALRNICHATVNSNTSWHMVHATCNMHMQCEANMHRATCKMHYQTWDVLRASCNIHNVTCIMIVHCVTRLVPCPSRKMHHAMSTMHQGKIHCETCNVHHVT